VIKFSEHLKEVFGEKVYKITLDAGFLCPHGGCIFCDGGSFSQAHSNLLSIEEQVEAGMTSLSEKFGAKKFLAYFQAYSNTNKPVEELEPIYRAALTREDVVGLSIGTRPDCVDEEKLDLIAGLNTYTWMEYGLQSAHDKTLEWLERGHDFACFERAVKMTKERGIKVCAHVILGLPETHEEVMQTACELARLKVDGVKIHMLCVLENTKLAVTPHVSLLSEDEYVALVCDFLAQLPPDIIVHRLAASGFSKTLIAPKWVNNKFSTLNKIERALCNKLLTK
jgi:radical SAM protein (TIGR01212 family)